LKGKYESAIIFHYVLLIIWQEHIYEVCYLFLQVGILMESYCSLLYIKVLCYVLPYLLRPRHKYFLISL